MYISVVSLIIYQVADYLEKPIFTNSRLIRSHLPITGQLK